MYLQPVAALIAPQKCRHLLCGFKAYKGQQHLLVQQITFLGCIVLEKKLNFRHNNLTFPLYAFHLKLKN